MTKGTRGMMAHGIVYLITNLINSHQYVGQTMFTVHRRWLAHIKETRLGSKYPLHQAIRKYGLENFKIETIIEIDAANLQELNGVLDRLEIGFIRDFNTWSKYGNGYNATMGGRAIGRGEFHPSFGSKRSDEYRAMMSQAKTGSSNPNFGKPAHPNQRMATSKRCKGIQLSQEHRAKIAASRMSPNPSPKALAKRKWKEKIRNGWIKRKYIKKSAGKSDVTNM